MYLKKKEGYAWYVMGMYTGKPVILLRVGGKGALNPGLQTSATHAGSPFSQEFLSRDTVILREDSGLLLSSSIFLSSWIWEAAFQHPLIVSQA